MNKNSNTYIIAYASIMVIFVAAVLTYASLSLSSRQAENVRIEKMGDILRSIGEGGDAENVPDKATYITDEYGKYITDSYAVNVVGERIDSLDAFTLLTNLKAQYDKDPGERLLPMFESKNSKGQVSYVIPLWGSGLWGPIWGYLALAPDWSTVNGAVFDHKGETPGLGAEIATPKFQNQFAGKQIYQDRKLTSIEIKKGGNSGNDPHTVDGLSGGTLTGHGLQSMLQDCLGDYNGYIQKQLSAVAAPVASDEEPGGESAADSLTNNQ